MNLKYGYHSIGENYGYYIDQAPQIVLDELKVQINELQSNFNNRKKLNDKLAGEIEHEYEISPQNQTKQYIKALSQEFENESQYISTNYKPLPTLQFNNLWVNFQKKHEYNPIHKHTGVYSFVIWYQIPFTFEKENEAKYNHKKKQISHHGKFAFVVPNSFSKLHNISNWLLDIDQSKEGYVAIFPSSLNHIVYPFYSSDEYRITVAGNIVIAN